MKPDEQKLLLAMPRNYPRQPHEETLRDIYFRLGIHWKRARYCAVKWASRGWYDWGVSVDLGWLTPKGIEAAKAIDAAVQAETGIAANDSLVHWEPKPPTH